MVRTFVAMLLMISASLARGQAVGGFADLAELLDALETADANIEKLSAKILYEREYALAGDLQTRDGSVSFVVSEKPEGGKSRAFAVVFDTTIIGERSEPDGRTFVFDGQWLTERIPEEKLVLRRQVAPPGADFDPLKIGEGPLPLPLGQKKADILANYNATMLPPEEGIGHREDLVQFTKKCAQLLLVPNEVRAPKDDFEEIRLWYVKGEKGLLPRMAMTLNKTGDEVVVRLWNVKLNENAEIDEADFDDEIPEGWDADIQPYRGAQMRPNEGISPVLARLIEQPEIATLGDTPKQEQPEFSLHPTVQRLLDAPHTDEDTAKDLRVFHGFWTEDDLDTPRRTALAMLIRGDVDHEIFGSEDVPADLRAEAAIRRGEPELALTLTEDDDSLRAIHLRTWAYSELAQYENAAKQSRRAVDVMLKERIESAAELTSGVMALIERARVAGPERADGSDFRTLQSLLTRAKGELDRLYWPATLAEAKLLYDKDERSAANEALIQVLKLNPQCAEAWHLLGLLAVDSFDFDRVRMLVDRLDELEEGRTAHGLLGAQVLAKARIRQGDSNDAARIAEEALERYPTSRDLFAMLAAAEASRFDFERANELLNELDTLSPGTEKGYLLAGWALSERRQYAEAAQMLEEAMRRAPNMPGPAIELGLLELQSGRDLNALSALRRVAELDPFNARAVNSLKLLEELVGYHTVESEHFVVRYKPGIDEILAREMTGPLELAHARITGDENGGIDHEPAQRTVIELMPDHAWFAVRIAGMPELHTIAASTGPVIAMEVPREGPGHKVGHYDWRRVIAHEYVHTVTLSRTKNRLPHWFTEAAAQYLEDAPRDEATCRLLGVKLQTDELFAMDEINIKFTRPETPTDRQQAYAQGHWMYEYMVERFGDEAPLRLMDAYAEGRTESEAMPSELGVSPEQFLEEFKVWARSEAEAWGVLMPEDAITIAELIEQDKIEGVPGPDDFVRWAGELPGHAEITEIAAKLALEEAGRTDDEIVPMLIAWAEAVPVAEEPHRLLARHYLDRGTAEGEDLALGHLEFLDARAQYTPAYAAALAKRYAEIGAKEKAIAKAERAVSIAPYDADQRELAARVNLVAGRLADTERHLDALTKLEPEIKQHATRLERVRELMAKNK
ncbi:MAG: peptidase MA family metallohydrolase [Phycisphaerales bacterium JB061]